MIDVQDRFTPISRFGIGFLSAFMIAEFVEINTLRIKSLSDFGEKLNITILGETGVFYVRNGIKERSGTSIKLFLKDDHPFGSADATKDDSALYKYVKETLRHIEFPVEIEATNIVEKVGESEYISEFGDVLTNEYPVRAFNFNLDNEIKGIKGSVKCFFLIEGESFLEQVILKESKVNYENQEYPYLHKLKIDSGQIFESYESIQTTKKYSQKQWIFNYGWYNRRN